MSQTYGTGTVSQTLYWIRALVVERADSNFAILRPRDFVNVSVFDGDGDRRSPVCAFHSSS